MSREWHLECQPPPCPYLAPVPKRGKRNEPAFMIETLKKLAALRGVSEQVIAEATTNNFHRVCSLNPNNL